MKSLAQETLDFVALWKSIQKSDNVLLTLHPNPDRDSACSNYVMLQILHKYGINARLIGGDNFAPQKFEDISEFIGDIKNISFADMIDFDEKEMDFPFDTFLVLDIPRPERISYILKNGLTGNEKFHILNLDHHAGNSFIPSEKVEVYLDVESSSTCELVLRFAIANNIKLEKDWLRALYVGIWSDTMGLSVQTSCRTLECARYIKERVDVDDIVSRVEKRWTENDLLHLVKIILGFTTYKVGETLVGVLVTDTNAVDFEKLQQFFWMQTVDVLVTCVKYDDYFRLGFISRTNVSGVAKKLAESFGGSGHENRAGAKETAIQNPMDMVKKITSTVTRVLLKT